MESFTLENVVESIQSAQTVEDRKYLDPWDKISVHFSHILILIIFIFILCFA